MRHSKQDLEAMLVVALIFATTLAVYATLALVHLP